MPQLIRPATTVKVAPKDGELEITVNINITVDGNVTASSEGGTVSSLSVKNDKDDDDKVNYIIPEFQSTNYKLQNF